MRVTLPYLMVDFVCRMTWSIGAIDRRYEKRPETEGVKAVAAGWNAEGQVRFGIIGGYWKGIAIRFQALMLAMAAVRNITCSPGNCSSTSA